MLISTSVHLFDRYWTLSLSSGALEDADPEEPGDEPQTTKLDAGGETLTSSGDLSDAEPEPLAFLTGFQAAHPTDPVQVRQT